MPFFRVSFKHVFAEVEATDEAAAREYALREFEDYGGTRADVKDFDVEEICGGCFQVTCDCLPTDAPCDPE